MNQNPYASSQAAAAEVHTDDDEAVLRVGKGQKLIIYAILMNFAMYGLRGQPMLAVALMLVTLGMSFTGIVRVCGGLGYGAGMKILMCVLQFVPLINIIALVVLNSRATRMLRDYGYEVGLLGARGI